MRERGALREAITPSGAAISDPKQIKSIPHVRAGLNALHAAVGLDACAWVSARVGGRGAGSSPPVASHVSPKGRKVFTANSLHSSVSGRSAHIRRLHGRKHNLFDATLPTRPEPSSPHWRFTVFNLHFIF